LAGEGKKKFGFWLLNGALATATCVVVFWNFFANRLWTFKSAPPSPLD
jgi:putative flippase GtrA